MLWIWAGENTARARLVSEPNHDQANNSELYWYLLWASTAEGSLGASFHLILTTVRELKLLWLVVCKKWGSDGLNNLSMITELESSRAGFCAVPSKPHHVAFPPLKSNLSAGHSSWSSRVWFRASHSLHQGLLSLSPHASFPWPFQVGLHSLSTSWTTKILCFCSFLVLFSLLYQVIDSINHQFPVRMSLLLRVLSQFPFPTLGLLNSISFVPGSYFSTEFNKLWSVDQLWAALWFCMVH